MHSSEPDDVGTHGAGAREPQWAIEVDGLTKDLRRRRVVDGVSFRIQRGSVCGLLGPRGSSKTTILRLLVGLMLPTSGEARIFGAEVTPGSPVLASVGAMVEPCGFVPHLTGIRNLRLHWQQAAGAGPLVGLDDALAAADLGVELDRKVATYSAAMRRRLGLARAMLGRPDVLILDEPTLGLDTAACRHTWDVLRGLSGRGATVLVASSSLIEVEQVCTQVIVVHRGRLVAEGPMPAPRSSTTAVVFSVDDPERAETILRDHAGVRSVRPVDDGLLVEPDGASRGELVGLLVGAGIRVDAVESPRGLGATLAQLLTEEPRA